LHAVLQKKKQLQKTTENLAEDVSCPLMLISIKCFNTGEIAMAWKPCDVMQVFKKSECGRVGGYKSISLTSVFGKTVEQYTAD